MKLEEIIMKNKKGMYEVFYQPGNSEKDNYKDIEDLKEFLDAAHITSETDMKVEGFKGEDGSVNKFCYKSIYVVPEEFAVALAYGTAFLVEHENENVRVPGDVVPGILGIEVSRFNEGAKDLYQDLI